MLLKGSLILAAIVLVQNVASHSCVCKCGPTGLFDDDHVNHHQDRIAPPLVVRPKPLPKPANLVPLAPIGGPCYKKQAIVKPAIVPRPVFTYATVTNNGHHHHHHNVHQSGYHQHEVVVKPSLPLHLDLHDLKEVKSGAPADAVSLALAYKLNQQDSFGTVAEDRLAFGFRKLPAELPKPCKQIAHKHDVAEENLYNLNGQIVELKKVAGHNYGVKNLAEEAEEELLNLDASEEVVHDYHHGLRGPSLGELGYGPAKAVQSQFVTVEAPSTECSVVKTSETTEKCCDGFQAGSVVYRDVPKFEPVYGETVDLSCESGEIPVRHVSVPGPSCSCGYYKSSSSSSSHGSQHQSVVIDKLYHH